MVTRLAWRAWMRALVLALGVQTAAVGTAFAIQIGGIDVETQYTGFVGSPADAGILTFNDATNGFNLPEPGLVTSSDLVALLGAAVNFEVLLDTSAFNPATGDVRNARFIGTGGSPEITMMSGNVVLLAFDVHFLDVEQAAHSGSLLGSPDGRILLGNPTPETFGVASNLTVAGGTLNALVGGVGTRAVMELLMTSLNPAMTQALRNSGYLNSSFTNGVGTSAESTTWNIAIIPEPGVMGLLGLAMLGTLAALRRQSR